MPAALSITVTNFVDVMLEGGGLLAGKEKRSETVEAFADPVDPHTWFPPELIERLGLAWRCDREVETGGGKRLLKLFSEADFTLSGRTVRVLVAEGAPGSPVKLGASLLSALDLAVGQDGEILACGEKSDNFLDIVE